MKNQFITLLKYCESRLNIDFEFDPDEILVLKTHLIAKWYEIIHLDEGISDKSIDLLCYIYFDTLYPTPLLFYQQYADDSQLISIPLEIGKKLIIG